MSEVSGLSDLQRQLGALGLGLSGEHLQACTEAAAAPILREAQARVPVATGDLRGHLETQSQHSQSHASTTVQVAQSGRGGAAHEAVFLEYGTSHMPARPFMRPAFEAAKEEAAQAFTNELKRQIKGTS